MKISLVDFLANPRIQNVETLDVTYWRSDKWVIEHSISLMLICVDLKINELNFQPDVPFTHASDYFYTSLKSHTGRRVSPTMLPHLREMNIVASNTWTPVIWSTILDRGRIWKLSWKITEDNHPNSTFDGILANVTLDNNFHLRELYFSTAYQEPVLLNQQSSRDFDLTEKGAIVANYLARNCRAFEKCQKAISVLLGLSKLRKNKLFCLAGRNVTTIVISMVWETRGTKVWTE